jgi:tRNA 2-selenouridine synthase
VALPLFDDYRALVTKRTPLIDLRAPVEFAKGSFPTAVNLPLMSDKEREAVGTCYKHKGNEAAVKLGHELVSGAVREARMQAWKDFIDIHPDAMLYCFRGGQRSRITQEWLHEAGYTIPRIRGGYKAFRSYLIAELESTEGRFRPLLLGGRTGSGKTLLLRELPQMIDLEGLAEHRGSAFGRKIAPQPTQIAFEDALAFDLINQLEKGYKTLIFEDEGKNIGRVYIPEKLAGHIVSGDLVILETPLEERTQITFDEYVTEAQREYREHFHEEGFAKWAASIGGSIDRIQKRLGGERHREIRAIFDQACRRQKETGDSESHKVWIERLLREYYDPMYDYQLGKRKERIIFRGNKEAVRAFLIEAAEISG